MTSPEQSYPTGPVPPRPAPHIRLPELGRRIQDRRRHDTPLLRIKSCLHHTRCIARVTDISLLSWANMGIERDLTARTPENT